MDYLQSPLLHKYKKSNAKIINFAGWEMPISFSGLIQEHECVRKSAGFFDISHMGVISIKGVNPKEFIQKFFPTNIYSISQGQSCYSLLLNDSGGIIDDLIIYDLGKHEENTSEVILIVNASRNKKDLEWIKNNLENAPIQISDAKKNKALIAIQGKNAFKYFEEWANYSISHIKKNGCEYKKLAKYKNDEEIFFAKTGYTGENGLEILLSIKLAEDLWDFLISKGVNPCGLGARDTLRLEAGLPLYGHELNETTNPYEAGLGWVVNLENNHFFYGRDSLEKISKNTTKTKLVGIEIKGKAIAREGCSIFKNKIKIGNITSGSWSPSMQKPIALGYVNTNCAKIDEEVEVVIRGKTFKAIISKKSFYKKD
tara:strand:- start:15587 stop:16696 length:1110 start_codon:yes stop_codon:yes gene_type:complete